MWPNICTRSTGECYAAVADAVLDALRLGRRRCFARVAGYRFLVHVGDVREIEQVVDEQQVVGLEVQVAGGRGPFRAVEPRQLLDLGGIGFGGLAHPDPHHVPALDDGIAAHAGALGNFLLTGDVGAPAVGSEFQSVVAAHEIVADDLAEG